MKQETTVAVALAGGGVIGYFFEAGSIRAMLDCNLPIHILSGVSAGAAVAALTAYNLPPDEFDPFENLKLTYLKDLDKLALIPYGLLGIKLMLKAKTYKRKESLYDLCYKAPKELIDLGAFEDFFSRLLQGTPKKLYITATDIDTGQMRIFTEKDNIAKAVRASCSFPGIGKPTVIDGSHYVDGFLSCCANVEALSGVNIVICVNPITCNSFESGFISDKGMFKIFEQSFRIFNQSRLAADLIKFTGQNGGQLLLIEPNGCQTMAKNPMRRDLKSEALQSGYDFTLKKLTENAELFQNAGIQLTWPKERKTFQ